MRRWQSVMTLGNHAEMILEAGDVGHHRLALGAVVVMILATGALGAVAAGSVARKR